MEKPYNQNFENHVRIVPAYIENHPSADGVTQFDERLVRLIELDEA